MSASRALVLQFARFALVGVAGFAVDVCVLYLATRLLGMGPWSGRAISYLAAASSTWYLNRRVTFADRRSPALGREWVRFVALNGLGGLVNYGVYAAWLYHAGTQGVSPAVGVALGSLSGLAVNFTLSRQIVFRPSGAARRRPSRHAPRTRMSSTRLAIAAVLLTGGLVWPALYNGQPLFFGDTSAYIRGADAGIQAALHHRSAWSLTGSDALAQPVVRMHVSMGNATDSIRHGSSIKDKSILYGRSPYYGALLYLGDLTGGFWLTVILQAIAVLVSLALAVRAIGAPLWPAWAIGAACVAAFTTAPFFASFLMPDVFAGIAILSAAALLADRGRLGLGGRLTAFALLALCVLFHESHPLIVGVLLLAAFTRNVLRRSWSNRRGLAAVGSALGVAVMGQIVFALLVQRVVGAPPLRPPFLMARLIEDGPGLRYLRETCPANGLEVCAYLDRLPMPANLFVWDTGPHGVFGSAVPAVRRRLAGEQLRFALAVLADHPFAQLAASVGNAASLIGMSGLAEFEYGPGEREDFAAKIPAQYLVRLQHTPAYRGALPTTVSAALSGASYALGAAVIIVALGRRKYRSVLAPPLLELAAWALAGVLANAVICGALSGPHNRYEARVVWVLPFVAVLIAFCLAATRHVACSAPVSCRTTEVEEARGG